MYIQNMAKTAKDIENKSFTTFPNHKAIAEMNKLKQRQTSETPSTIMPQPSKDEQDSFLAAAIMSMCMNGKGLNHSSAIIMLILSLIV